jgi:DNA helicase HerA-like ATPase
MSIKARLESLASVDLFAEIPSESAFVGKPFYFDYSLVRVLANDAWKDRVGGIPAGAFLVAVYDNAQASPEAVLLRVLGPCRLPTDNDVMAAMVDHYKETPPEQAEGKLDSFTRYEFQFSGLECRVLGSFYRRDSRTLFAADIENFFSANNYSVYKPVGRVLEYIVNFREGAAVPGAPGDQRIGVVRYSASQRRPAPEEVPVYVSAVDYLGKRTALFGMTRTGKSNTVKKIIQATNELAASSTEVKPVGQVIFDVNGEYANDNEQDEGRAIYQLYDKKVTRYSILEKPGFRVMKVNFHESIVEGFELIRGHLDEDNSIYTRAFLTVNWDEPDDSDKGQTIRFERRLACYRTILYKAGLLPATDRIRFEGASEINDQVGIDPKKGISLEHAARWFTWVWEQYEDFPFFAKYSKTKQREWADEELKILLRFLTRCAKPGSQPTEAGYQKLRPLGELHSAKASQSFEDEIVALLRKGEIVIVDLSQGSPVVQRTMSDRLCKSIFSDAMKRFIANETANFVQMYFEEAHNLFPKKSDSDLTIVYNRIAKEGAKLRLGLIYATQEVSSISSNVLKNTQNWFVSHLNNDDELKEIAKFYDYQDFVDSLRRATDKGFIRMKTYSNAFTVPVQIDRFTAAGAEER